MNGNRIFLFVVLCIMFAAAATGIMFMVNGPRESVIHPAVIVLLAPVTVIGAWKISGIDPDDTTISSAHT